MHELSFKGQGNWSFKIQIRMRMPRAVNRNGLFQSSLHLGLRVVEMVSTLHIRAIVSTGLMRQEWLDFTRDRVINNNGIH